MPKVNFDVSAEEMDRFDKVALALGLSRAELMRRATSYYCDALDKRFADGGGFVGAVESIRAAAVTSAGLPEV